MTTDTPTPWTAIVIVPRMRRKNRGVIYDLFEYHWRMRKKDKKVLWSKGKLITSYWEPLKAQWEAHELARACKCRVLNIRHNHEVGEMTGHEIIAWKLHVESTQPNHPQSFQRSSSSKATTAPVERSSAPDDLHLR